MSSKLSTLKSTLQLQSYAFIIAKWMLLFMSFILRKKALAATLRPNCTRNLNPKKKIRNTLNLNHKKKIRNTMNLNPYRRSENTTCIKSSLQLLWWWVKRHQKIVSKTDACLSLNPLTKNTYNKYENVVSNYYMMRNTSKIALKKWCKKSKSATID